MKFHVFHLFIKKIKQTKINPILLNPVLFDSIDSSGIYIMFWCFFFQIISQPIEKKNKVIT